MCLNGLKCAHNARKLHFESTKFSSGNMPPKLLVKLAQITHLKSWIHPCTVTVYDNIKKLTTPLALVFFISLVFQMHVSTIHGSWCFIC